MSPAPHAPCRGQHCPVVAMLLAPRSNPLPSHCHIPFPCPLPVCAHRAPMSPPLPRSSGHGRRPEAGVPQDGVLSGEHRLGHTDAALDAPCVVDVLRAHAKVAPSAVDVDGLRLHVAVLRVSSASATVGDRRGAPWPPLQGVLELRLLRSKSHRLNRWTHLYNHAVSELILACRIAHRPSP